MGKVGQHFSDFRKSTPKSVLWLLMIAAFVIVVVLLLLLNSGKKPKKVIQEEDVIPVTPELRFEPNAPIDWSNTLVDETRTAEIQVYANTRVQITNVVVQVEGEEDDNVGLSATATCTNEQTWVTEDTPCLITLDYTPTHTIPRTNVGVTLTWTAFEIGPDQNETKNAITAVIGAHEAKKAVAEEDNPKAKPTPEPEPYEEEPFAESELPDDGEPESNFNVDEGDFDFQEDIDDIAPPIDFGKSAPMPGAKSAEKKYFSPFGNNCSDFSFPGYNTAGIQSGWITPESGAYYYHPFSDADCKNPTGIYNADTGYIMDIKNPSRKIGSDAEHIRLTVQERMPKLSGSTSTRAKAGRAQQLSDADLGIQIVSPGDMGANFAKDRAFHVGLKPRKKINEFAGYSDSEAVYSTLPYDRSFVLRQYKPIPATIVSDIQADSKLLESGLPVRATVDRNVYSDNGRTIIIPTGTLMLGRVVGDLPGPYKAVGRMEIEWYQFIRPDGVEFSFDGSNNPFSADSQGRKGVPGHGSTDYVQQFVMPMLTAIVPAAVNLIAPISDKFVNQIDLDNNTVVQSGTVRSSELAKNEIITAWNNVATKLLVDMMDNTTPPFSIAAGTRITVFSPVDLVVTCGDPADGDTRNCAVHAPARLNRGSVSRSATDENRTVEELIGQVRSLMESSLKDCCVEDENGAWRADNSKMNSSACSGYSFTTMDFYCRSFGTYKATNNAKQEAIIQNQKEQFQNNTPQGSKEYNTQVLGLKYDENGNIKNPFKSEKKESAPAQDSGGAVTCGDGANPDANGCCPGETYTDMGDQGFNCCPDAGGDCFPPIEL